MTSMQVFEIIASELDFPENISLTEAAYILKFYFPELYDILLKTMTQEVVQNIKRKEGMSA